MKPKGLSRKICRIAKTKARTEKMINTAFQERGRLLEIPSSLMAGFLIPLKREGQPSLHFFFFLSG